jgi:hypothetical protein
MTTSQFIELPGIRVYRFVQKMEAWPVDLHCDATRRHLPTEADANAEGLRPLDRGIARDAWLAAVRIEN